MSRGDRNIAIGVSLVLGYLAYTKFLKPVGYTPGKVKRYIDRLLLNIVGFRVNPSNGNIELIVRVTNPNPDALNLQSIAGKIYLRGNYVGDIVYYARQVIAPLQDSNLVLAVRVKAAPVFAYIMQYLTGQIKGADLVFEGVVSVNDQILNVKERFVL